MHNAVIGAHLCHPFSSLANPESPAQNTTVNCEQFHATSKKKKLVRGEPGNFELQFPPCRLRIGSSTHWYAAEQGGKRKATARARGAAGARWRCTHMEGPGVETKAEREAPWAADRQWATSG